MRYLHTMLRVRNLDAALDFYCRPARPAGSPPDGWTRRAATRWCFWPRPRRAGREAALGAGRRRAEVELTYNWDTEDYGEARYFGHLAYEVDDIYATCEKLQKAGVTINRPPRDGNMAFVRSPDRHSIELLQKGKPLPPKEPWASMPNTGKW